MSAGAFTIVKDRYGGVTCSPVGYTDETYDAFEAELTRCLADWVAGGVRGVWFKLPVSATTTRMLGGLLRTAFTVHHATAEYFMLTRWLPAEEPNMLPAFAFTYVGVGGLVLNDATDELLVVRERYSMDGVQRWSLPGGLTNRGERLPAAVEREVWEETGVRCAFQGTVYMRHLPQYLHGCCDLYVVCATRPLSFEITADEREVSAARWLPVRDFLCDGAVYRPFRDVVWQHLLAAHRGLPPWGVRPDSMQLGTRRIDFDVYAAAGIASELLAAKDAGESTASAAGQGPLGTRAAAEIAVASPPGASGASSGCQSASAAGADPVAVSECPGGGGAASMPSAPRAAGIGGGAAAEPAPKPETCAAAERTTGMSLQLLDEVLTVRAARRLKGAAAHSDVR